jgi:hypothetical protein
MNTHYYRLTCIAPSFYQKRDCETLMGMTAESDGGRFIAQMEFDTIEEAREWMNDRNYELNGAEDISDAQFATNYRTINKGSEPTMTCGTVYAKAERMEVEDED